MHEGQLDVTVELVEGLVKEQFPEWSGLAVRAVPSHGTVNALFRIGDGLVARFPILPGDAATVQQELGDEADAARRLHTMSPYPTPQPIAIGAPASGYPLPWAVQTWVDGTIAYDADVAGSTGFAEDLARFVLALRAQPTEGRVFTGSWRGGVLTSQDEYVADGLERSRGMIDVDELARLWADLRTTPRTEPDAWTHRDLMPGNLLAKDGRLAGIIDVGTFTVSDPAMDLQPAWNLLDPTAREAFRTALGSDDAEWRRGMGWSFAQAIGCLWYYVETNPVMSRTAHHTLTALLTSP
ncbi:aminoglycoside phosphotransferase (APT) family kinase protein [Kribbella sp. VKM Ac-2571]|uniref:aminoglycoside phosphotransferase family protein n=1 Tax=Kribbella sp. VKM Ac-2571 TaxID=2512222 RepID=UPI00105C3B82|nr:aminoglycoside phosphotransferase family protein [Kribbella sp. VKM Ac-2571]TDO68681.1 aminoglycoside phosphotransferase (APT) family kinase protein [Kribbella sp. VKM Ac-2571]